MLFRHFARLSVALALFSLVRFTVADDASSAKVTKPIRVAVYDDAGVSGKVAGLIELLKTHAELQVTKVDGQDIRASKLQDIDVALFPGGSGSGEAKSLEEAGRKEVRSFVERGGGYLGICGGIFSVSRL